MNTTWKQIGKAIGQKKVNTLWCNAPTYEKVTLNLGGLGGMKVELHEHLPDGILFLVHKGQLQVPSLTTPSVYGMYKMEENVQHREDKKAHPVHDIQKRDEGERRHIGGHYGQLSLQTPD